MPTILIADDSATVRSTVKVHLMGHGYEFLEAEDGSRALRLLKMVPVALVITDYRMPGLDGVALMERIRAESTGIAGTPFILVSSDHDRTLRERALAAGASAFLRKPINSGELASAVVRLVPAEVSARPVSGVHVSESHAHDAASPAHSGRS